MVKIMRPEFGLKYCRKILVAILKLKFVEILKLNFDQILITLTLLKALNPRVYCACGNILCNAQNWVVIPSIIALSRHFAHMKKENLV